MDRELRWYELVDRVKNFHGDHELFQKRVVGNEAFYMDLYNLKEDIILDSCKVQELNSEQLLKTVFTMVYNFIAKMNDAFLIFDEDTRIHDDVFEACFFTTLGIFIHETKRIKGMSLRTFVYNNSLNYYNEKDSSNYFLFEYPSDIFLKEEATLRQVRHRLLSTRPAYDKHSEWSAVRSDSEHEWIFYYTLEVMPDDLKDIFKRIGNLYKGIYKELNSAKDEGYKGRLESTYKSFLAKLKKIKYEKILELQEEILSHICEQEKYYGMNIYRLERELRLYIITNEVKKLLQCKDQAEEIDILRKSILLNDIHFPKLYQAFSNLSDVKYTAFCANSFSCFIDLVVSSSRLIIDELIEKSFFGENWENMFLDTIDKMTERVFYDPKQFDYTVTSGSQEKFTEILAAPVRDLLFRTIGLSFPR